MPWRTWFHILSATMTQSSIFSCIVFFVLSLLMRLKTVHLVSSKKSLLSISRLWRYAGFRNCRLNFLLYYNEPWLFVDRQCGEIPKIYHWSMDSGVHSVCFRGNFAIKTIAGFLRKRSFERCVTRWSMLFICSMFSCWRVFYRFGHWASTSTVDMTVIQIYEYLTTISFSFY